MLIKQKASILSNINSVWLKWGIWTQANTYNQQLTRINLLPGNWKLFHYDTLFTIISEVLSPKCFLQIGHWSWKCFSITPYHRESFILVEQNSCKFTTQKSWFLFLIDDICIQYMILWFSDFFLSWYVFFTYSRKWLRTKTRTEKWK